MPDGASAIWRHDHVDDEWGRPAIPLAPLLANAYVHWVASGWMHDHLPMPQIWVPCRIEKMKNHQTHARHVVFWYVGQSPNTLHDVRDVLDRLCWLVWGVKVVVMQGRLWGYPTFGCGKLCQGSIFSETLKCNHNLVKNFPWVKTWRGPCTEFYDFLSSVFICHLSLIGTPFQNVSLMHWKEEVPPFDMFFFPEHSVPIYPVVSHHFLH